jgi:putative salt-induced outer membrane protein
MKKQIAIILAATGMMVGFAETSTNTSPSVGPKPRQHPWTKSISTGLTLTRGNKSTTLFSADFRAQRKTPTDEYLLGLGGAYGQQDSRDTVNNYKAVAQWNHLFTPRFFGYLLADGLQDRIKNLDYRLTIGPGMGYYFLKRTNISLALETGAGFEAQRLGGKDQAFATARFADRFEYRLTDHAKLWQSLEVLPQVDKFNNFVVNFEIGLEAPLSKTLSLKTYLSDSYANEPAPGRVKNDLKLVAGVAYKF